MKIIGYVIVKSLSELYIITYPMQYTDYMRLTLKTALMSLNRVLIIMINPFHMLVCLYVLIVRKEINTINTIGLIKNIIPIKSIGKAN